MLRVGLVGLGDMGIGLARNILKAGFTLRGFDLREERRRMLADLGGKPAGSINEVGADSDIVFVMVLNGKQVQDVVLGKEGLIESMRPDTCVLVTATINPSEVKSLVQPLKEKKLRLIDSPVSGGKGGAEGGTLTMMVATEKENFDRYKTVFEAVGKNIYHVGESVGQGQVIKGALQALIGSTFTAIFEALVLGTKAGADPETMFEVFCASGVGSGLLKNCGELILDRKFEKTGSHIGTMYKDLSISMAMARENGCMMMTAAAAYELFQAGKSLYPNGDNWSIVKFLEQIAGTEVKRMKK